MALMAERRESSARKTLLYVTSRGHDYVELRNDTKKKREEGSRFILYCILCRVQCYCRCAIYNHLNGKLHKRNLSIALKSLVLPRPYPFVSFMPHRPFSYKDGVWFFHENNPDVRTDDVGRVVVCNKPGAFSVVPSVTATKVCKFIPSRCLTIPQVMQDDVISDLKLEFNGYGLISAGTSDHGTINSIWCSFVDGEYRYEEQAQYHIVTFAYKQNTGVTDHFKGPYKARTQFGEHLMLGYDDLEEIASDSKASRKSRRNARRGMRKLKHDYASPRVCSICKELIVPGNDVSTLLNMNSLRLFCCAWDRKVNQSKLFHIFHTSCLVHWVLFCESEALKNDAMEHGGNNRLEIHNILCVCCPDCLCTGELADGQQCYYCDDYDEKVRQLEDYLKKTVEANKSWKEKLVDCEPEDSHYCSTGLSFSHPDDQELDIEFEDTPIKSFEFYRPADES